MGKGGAPAVLKCDICSKEKGKDVFIYKSQYRIHMRSHKYDHDGINA